KQPKRLTDLARDVIAGTDTPRMAGKSLRPQTERAKRRTTPRRVESHVGVKEKRNVVFLDDEVAFVHLRSERQLIEIFRLQLRPRRVQANAAVVAVTGACNPAERFAVGELHDGVIELAGYDEINLGVAQKAIGFDLDMRPNECDLQIGLRILHFSYQRNV